MKSIEFLMCFWRWLARVFGPSECLVRPARQKMSKTRDFSHISAQMCEKSRVFDPFVAPYLIRPPGILILILTLANTRIRISISISISIRISIRIRIRITLALALAPY